MKKKKLFAMALVGMTAGFGVNAEAHPQCGGCPQEVTLSDQQNGGAMGSSVDCAHLSEAEMDFAGKLNAKNREAFCGKFSAAQREQAMQMGPMMQPDDAVSTVMMENNMSMQEKRTKLSK